MKEFTLPIAVALFLACLRSDASAFGGAAPAGPSHDSQAPFPATTVPVSSSSLVTGGSGYVGRAILHEILRQEEEPLRRHQPPPTDSGHRSHHTLVSLVRPGRVASEQNYWDAVHREQIQQRLVGDGGAGDAATAPPKVVVLPYDMLDDGVSLRYALDSVAPSDDDATTRTVVYHTAAVFGPTDDHRQTALDNVRGTESLVRALAAARDAHGAAGGGLCCHLILTSSMAAVRATSQEPCNGIHYTADDWNTLSRLGANWGESYQWSKAASEKRAMELCRELNLPLTSLCPSFVFGPPAGAHGTLSGSYSLELVGKWVRGESPVQSRLFVDVRDVARAHVAAAFASTESCVAANRRYIVSTESRVPSRDLAEWLREACRSHHRDPDRIHSDDEFKGGAIPVGQKEVEAAERLRADLGIELRPVRETITEMAEALLRAESSSGVPS